MGASHWDYLVAYRDDAAVALTALREAVCASGDYYWTFDGIRPRPSMVDDPAWGDEDVWQEGTHSILDIVEIAPPGSADVAYGETLVVSAEHARIVFGTDRPTAADVERVGGPSGDAMRQLLPARGIGRHLIVYTGDTPSHLLFWGYSGD